MPVIDLFPLTRLLPPEIKELPPHSPTEAKIIRTQRRIFQLVDYCTSPDVPIDLSYFVLGYYHKIVPGFKTLEQLTHFLAVTASLLSKPQTPSEESNDWDKIWLRELLLIEIELEELEKRDLDFILHCSDPEDDGSLLLIDTDSETPDPALWLLSEDSDQ